MPLGSVQMAVGEIGTLLVSDHALLAAQAPRLVLRQLTRAYALHDLAMLLRLHPVDTR